MLPSEIDEETWKLRAEIPELNSPTATLINSNSDEEYYQSISKKPKKLKEEKWNLIPEYERKEQGLVKSVEWNIERDVEDPRNWNDSRKRRTAIIGISFCALVSACISAYSISMDTVISEFQISEVTAALGIVLFSISFGVSFL